MLTMLNHTNRSILAMAAVSSYTRKRRTFVKGAKDGVCGEQILSCKEIQIDDKYCTFWFKNGTVWQTFCVEKNLATNFAYGENLYISSTTTYNQHVEAQQNTMPPLKRRRCEDGKAMPCFDLASMDTLYLHCPLIVIRPRCWLLKHSSSDIPTKTISLKDKDTDK